MIYQLKSVIGFQEKEEKKEETPEDVAAITEEASKENDDSADSEMLKTRIDTLTLSARTTNALSQAGIRTVGGLARKREEDILALEGLGVKGVQEIKRALSNFGITLKS